MLARASLGTRGILMLLGITAAAHGCALGPRLVGQSALAYNRVLQRTADEQLLLNLVRLKYHDAPLFLEVQSLATQFIVRRSASISGRVYERLPHPGNFLDGSVEGVLEERPTVSYTPLAGGAFVQRFMAPLGLDTLTLLLNSGWSVDRVFRLTVQRMNGVENAPSASGPTPAIAPPFAEFAETMHALRVLQQAGALDVGSVPSEGGPVVVLRMAPTGADRRAARTVEQMLHLAPHTGQYPLVLGTGRRPAATTQPQTQIMLNTRSLLSILFYLSHGIEVPALHEARGYVTRTVDAEGQPFAWSDVTGDLLRVRYAETRPAAASIAVQHRGYWYYVARDDLQSKATFALLGHLISLQAGGNAVGVPVLTLSIGK